jgi:hypothetical protein
MIGMWRCLGHLYVGYVVTSCITKQGQRYSIPTAMITSASGGWKAGRRRAWLFAVACHKSGRNFDLTAEIRDRGAAVAVLHACCTLCLLRSHRTPTAALTQLHMSWPSTLTFPALTLAGGCAVYFAARYALHRSPVADLPGPPSSSLLLGHFREAVADDDDLLVPRWTKEYGHVFKFYFLFHVRPLSPFACSSDLGAQSPRLVTTDLKAIGHILAHPDAFPKPDAAQNFLRYIFGDGLLVSQGAAHRMQRKIMNPAFGPTQLRELTGIFLDKANEVSVRKHLCIISCSQKHSSATSGSLRLARRAAQQRVWTHCKA